jgi:mono/diheme cytochrome c family protein
MSMRDSGRLLSRLSFSAILLHVLGAPAQATDLAAARQLYDQHCASCHGFDGKSRFPDVPDLRNTGAGSAPGFEAVNKLKLGGPRKPPFLGRLTDQQLMDTLVYARTLK